MTRSHASRAIVRRRTPRGQGLLPGLGLAMVLAMVLAMGALGCGDNQDPAGAEALWNALQQTDYRSWERAPGYETRMPSGAPHGDSVDIYINGTLADALAKGEPLEAWPNGSLIVKDGFDDGDLDLVAVMEKRLTGWYWAEYADDGEALYSGEPDLCIDCHRSGADFVRAFGFP